jgi:hypothetical protein
MAILSVDQGHLQLKMPVLGHKQDSQTAETLSSADEHPDRSRPKFRRFDTAYYQQVGDVSKPVGSRPQWLLP